MNFRLWCMSVSIALCIGGAILIAQGPQINPYTQIRGPAPSFALTITPSSITIAPGVVVGGAGPFGVNGASLRWAGTTDSGDVLVGPGVSGTLPVCYYSVGLQASDLATTTFAGSGCGPISSLPPGTYVQQIQVTNGIFQPQGSSYIPVPGP